MINEFIELKESQENTKSLQSNIIEIDDKIDSLSTLFNRSSKQLEGFITKMGKFEESVDDWSQFLEQARTELAACQKSFENLQELDENYERLQVGWIVKVFFWTGLKA